MADVVGQTQAVVDNSIAKAREAQQKFEEAKAKFEEVKAKADAAAKKAKEAQQKIKEAQAVFKAAGGISGGGISAVVAVLVGTLRAQLVLIVQKEVLKMLNKFINQCPNPKDLQRIIKVRNNLLKNINSFQKRIDKLAKIAQTLLITVTVVKLLIKIITSIPIPTSVPPGAGIPVNILTKYSNALIKLNKTLDKLLAEAAAITALITAVSAIIRSLKQRLESIDAQIQACIQNPVQALEQASVTESATQAGNAQAGNTQAEGVYYKGYKLEIVQDVVDFKLAPKRHAIAIDKRGIQVLQGPSSFSSSTDILLDELKFKIDQLL